MVATTGRRDDDRRDDGFLVNALAGAVVSVALPFVPFSLLLGGAVTSFVLLVVADAVGPVVVLAVLGAFFLAGAALVHAWEAPVGAGSGRADGVPEG